MSVKRSKPQLPRSAHQISLARKHLRSMTWTQRLEVMVEAGLLTPEQFEVGKRRFEKIEAAGRRPEDYTAAELAEL